jgi:hypothetical protein
VSEVLGKVTTRTFDTPRGPDVVHRIRVPHAWLESGEIVEFEVPRNLSCAACDGGGCDLCERSGAITLRGRQELPEILSVTLPMRNTASDSRAVVIRIPEHGGLPPEHGGLPPEHEGRLPRGLLLLRVEPAEIADPGVSRVVPPRSLLPVELLRRSLRVLKPTTPRARLLAVMALIVIAAGLAFLAFRRHRGLG